MIRFVAWAGLLGCTGAPPTEPDDGYLIVAEGLGGAVLSVWGSASDDVWLVGADDGSGPLVLHWDGSAWERLHSGTEGDLWWVWGEPGRVSFVGARGRLVELDRATGAFSETQIADPAHTLFGIWGAGSSRWAVGGDVLGNLDGVVLRSTGGAWEPVGEVPRAGESRRIAFKVWGRSADEVVVVGSHALLMRWDGAALAALPAPVFETSPLTTVAGDGTQVIAVGGYGNAVVARDDGSGWVDDSPPPTAAAPFFNGVHARDGRVVACGGQGSSYTRSASGWEPLGDPATLLDFHACWIAPDGGVWLAGGDLISLDDGLIAVQDAQVPRYDGGG